MAGKSNNIKIKKKKTFQSGNKKAFDGVDEKEVRLEMGFRQWLGEQQEQAGIYQVETQECRQLCHLGSS